jgi:hypothetical protein
MSKHSIQIDDNELYRNISEYCKLNNLKINKFVTELLKKQFAIEMYGDIPFGIMSNNIIPVKTIVEDNSDKQNIPVIETEEKIEKKEIINLENNINKEVKSKKRRL